jgi:hypothetical protein
MIVYIVILAILTVITHGKIFALLLPIVLASLLLSLVPKDR